jgi:two-component system, OmpR family, KDP operon response regulator KdpE
MSASPLKVLVVDDEPPIRKLLRMGLGTQGYQTIDAPNARAALDLMSSTPDLVILDLGLPDMQGHELLSMIRSRNPSIPIIVLSSRGDEVGKVQALDFGADDYVTKPFGMEELLARMRTALRHQLHVQGEPPLFKAGDLLVDLVRRVVKVGGKVVKLSPKEYELLRGDGAAGGKGAYPQIPVKSALGYPYRCAISPRVCAKIETKDRT